MSQDTNSKSGALIHQQFRAQNALETLDIATGKFEIVPVHDHAQVPLAIIDEYARLPSSTGSLLLRSSSVAIDESKSVTELLLDRFLERLPPCGGFVGRVSEVGEPAGVGAEQSADSLTKGGKESSISSIHPNKLRHDIPPEIRARLALSGGKSRGS